MQRVLLEKGLKLVNSKEPAQLQAQVHRYCPPSIGHLFAIPREGQGSLEWRTELSGQPRRIDELNKPEQKQLRERLTQRLAALASLVDELSRRGDPAAEALRALPSQPADDTLYSVGGEPLLIRWVPTELITPLANEAAPVSAPPQPPVPSARWQRWLLPIGLPFLIGAFALIGLWLTIYHWQWFSLPWHDDIEVVSNPRDGLATEERVSAEPVLGTGDIQVTLRWDSTDDLDLAVIDPLGDTAFFNSPTTTSGGQLDVDSNAGCTSSSQAPVENIFWSSNSTPEGTYVAAVSLFSRCGHDLASPIPFELSITVDGNTDIQTGTVSDQRPRQIFEFNFTQDG